MKEEAKIIHNICKVLKDNYNKNFIFYPDELPYNPTEENYPHIHSRFEIRMLFNLNKDGSCNYQDIKEILLTPSGIKHLTISLNEVPQALTIRLGLNAMLYFRGQEPIMEMSVTDKLAAYGFSVECFLNFFNNLNKENFSKEHALHALVFFLSSLALSMDNDDCTNPASPGQKLKAYIHQHYYDQDFTINKLAKWSNTSPNYIQQIFKKEFATTPRNYLINYRLLQAKNMLKQNKYSIKEVAYNTGWSDQHYFANCYKKYFGISPSFEKNSTK